jgi:hypothetical protein
MLDKTQARDMPVSFCLSVNAFTISAAATFRRTPDESGLSLTEAPTLQNEFLVPVVTAPQPMRRRSQVGEPPPKLNWL